MFRIKLKNVCYHLYVILHMEIVYHIWFAELRILYRLFQRESFRMERYQTIANWPTFYRILQSIKHTQSITTNRQDPPTTTLTLRITSSSNTTILMYSNSCSLVRISFIGFDWVFFDMAQMPTRTCLPVEDVLQSESAPSLFWIKSMSPCLEETGKWQCEKRKFEVLVV